MAVGLRADKSLCQALFLLPPAQPSCLPWLRADTHHAGAWEGHLAPIGPPLVLRTILVGKGPLEDLPDICHVVHTDGKSLEHGTARGRQGQSGWGDHRVGRRQPDSMGKIEGRVPIVDRDPKPIPGREREAENTATEPPSQGQAGAHGEAGTWSRGSTKEAGGASLAPVGG